MLIILQFEDKNSDGRVFNHRIRDCILDLCVSLEDANTAEEFQAEVAEFYKKYWDIVGPTVIKAVKSFFHSGKILKQINHTFIFFADIVPDDVGRY